MKPTELEELIRNMNYHTTIALENHLTHSNTVLSYNGFLYSISMASCIIMFDDYEVIRNERLNLYLDHHFIGVINPYDLERIEY